MIEPRSELKPDTDPPNQARSERVTRYRYEKAFVDALLSTAVIAWNCLYLRLTIMMKTRFFWAGYPCINGLTQGINSRFIIGELLQVPVL